MTTPQIIDNELRADNSFEVIIDDKPCLCQKGEFIYDVAKRNNIHIPTLCRHDGLEHRGACRICIVEVITKGRSKVVASCIFPLEAPCEIRTHSEKIMQERKVLLMLLAARAPESEEIAQLAAEYDAQIPSSFVRLDNERCILCGLCMQACDELGTGAISTILRGTEKRVDTPYSKPAATCIGCRSCAEVCPTQAISWTQDKDAKTRTIWGKNFTLLTCDACGKILGTEEEIAHAAQYSNQDEKHLCIRCKNKALSDAMRSAYAVS